MPCITYLIPRLVPLQRPASSNFRVVIIVLQSHDAEFQRETNKRLYKLGLLASRIDLRFGLFTYDAPSFFFFSLQLLLHQILFIDFRIADTELEWLLAQVDCDLRSGMVQSNCGEVLAMHIDERRAQEKPVLSEKDAPFFSINAATNDVTLSKLHAILELYWCWYSSTDLLPMISYHVEYTDAREPDQRGDS